MNTLIFTLPNGLRHVHRYINSPVLYCGLSINAGARHELPAENGMAHLVEHMVFKGTTHRNAYQINNRLENVGGELNAFTTKEETVLHATVLKSDAEKAIELLADMAFRSTFPEKELIKEKEVIIDEINSYKDNPSEQIFDDFDRLLFAGLPLGQPILGTAKTLGYIKQSQLKAFVNKHYQPAQMVFSTIGKITPKRIEQLVTKHFSGIVSMQATNTDCLAPRMDSAIEKESAYKPFRKIETRNTFQAHCVMGTRAYSLHDSRRIGLSLLMNYLGGPAANSRLNTLLREKHGLVYTIEASYSPYADNGAAIIYFGADKENVSRCEELIRGELQALRTKPFGTTQLHRIKKQLLGQLAINSDNAEAQMLSQAKCLMTYNYVETIEQLKAKIVALTADELQDIANDVFAEGILSTLLYN